MYQKNLAMTAVITILNVDDIVMKTAIHSYITIVKVLL